MDRLDRSIEEGNRRQYGRGSGDNGKRNGLDGAAQGGIPGVDSVPIHVLAIRESQSE
jgi:hypothetical protein